MTELRWILLAAGLALLAGIYAWGARARRRSAAPGADRVTRVEQPRAHVAAAEPRRVEPEVRLDDVADEASEPLPVLDAEATPAPAPRREPRFGPPTVPSVPPVAAATPAAVAPEAPAAAREATPPTEERKAPAQKIIAVRVVASAGTQFEGTALHEAIVAGGFAFGRYEIFHRLGAGGRPIVSLASLREPGTFDPDTLTEGSYRGILLFTVLPGPLPGEAAFDELLDAARALAARLGGQLQDDRGASLSVQRVSHLREEAVEFERTRSRPPAR